MLHDDRNRPVAKEGGGSQWSTLQESTSEREKNNRKIKKSTGIRHATRDPQPPPQP